jgi:chromosome segregation ATPase
MKVLLVILTGAEIGVWAALLFTIGFALHFLWTQRQLVKQDPSQKEKLLREETARWKNRFLQETGTLSRELDRLRLEAETAVDRCSSLESALSSKEELLNHSKQEHRIYRELLTSSLRSGETLEKKIEQVVTLSAPIPPAEDSLHLNQGRTLQADLHRAEVRIEELELKLMDREDEIQQLQATEGGSGDVNDELLEKISQLESQLIHARSKAEALEQANTRIRELEEQLEDSERHRESLNNSHHRLTEENEEQYNHFKTQMNELVAARQRLAHLDSQAEEPPRG